MNRNVLKELFPKEGPVQSDAIELLTRVLQWLTGGEEEKGEDLVKLMADPKMSPEEKYATLLTAAATVSMFMSLHQNGIEASIHDALSITLGNELTAGPLVAVGRGQSTLISTEEFKVALTEAARHTGIEHDSMLEEMDVMSLVGVQIEEADDVDRLQFEVLSQETGLN